MNKLPNVDHPEAFGQHTNADIASQISEANLLFSTLLSLQVQKQSSQSEGKAEDKVCMIFFSNSCVSAFIGTKVSL